MLPLIAANSNYHCEAVKNDDANLLIQLYVDNIGLTNPIGQQKDRHEMTMVYFLL